MSKIVSIEKNIPHTLAELMCVACKHRWVGAFPSDTWLSDLECPHCFQRGYIINTGQEIDDKLQEAGQYAT